MKFTASYLLILINGCTKPNLSALVNFLTIMCLKLHKIKGERENKRKGKKRKWRGRNKRIRRKRGRKRSMERR